jgi:uncharacterized protein (TIGR03435 family)
MTLRIVTSNFTRAFVVVCVFTGHGFPQQPVFDAVSVKMAEPLPRPLSSGASGGPGTSSPGRFRVPHAAMVELVARAYGVTAEQVSGGPGWVRDMTGSLYEVEATMPPDTTQQQFQLMLQNLLAERFHLRVHHDSRGGTAYDLVVAKGGPKLKEVTPDPNAAPAIPQEPVRRSGPPVLGKDGFPVLDPGRRVVIQYSPGAMRGKYQEMSMADFVTMLQTNLIPRALFANPFGSPTPRVSDKTGLTGKYDFILEFACASCGAPRPAAPDASPADTASEPTGLPSIFTALEKQLGLRLEKGQDAPLDVIVIDRVEKVPEGN